MGDTSVFDWLFRVGKHHFLSDRLTFSLSQVFIINLLRDSKYYHFRPVMDTYIQKHFAGALAYKWVLKSRPLFWRVPKQRCADKLDGDTAGMLFYVLQVLSSSPIRSFFLK